MMCLFLEPALQISGHHRAYLYSLVCIIVYNMYRVEHIVYIMYKIVYIMYNIVYIMYNIVYILYNMVLFSTYHETDRLPANLSVSLCLKVT